MLEAPLISPPIESRAGTLDRYLTRALTYFDIWQHPLTIGELYAFLPARVDTVAEFRQICDDAVLRGIIGSDGEYYFLPTRGSGAAARRREREEHARRLWQIARYSTHIIKRCPFVRAVAVSGDLSKDSTDPTSDIDFFIITVSGRLWIARTLLILFKKVFLLNSRKFFCVNSFVSEDHLVLDDRSLYQATEVATLKPVYRASLLHDYIDANGWIREYFPNFADAPRPSPRSDERRSVLQGVLEAVINLLPAERIDRALQSKMEQVWMKRYPQFDAPTRLRIFRSTRSESRAYVGNFEDRILGLYRQKLREHEATP